MPDQRPPRVATGERDTLHALLQYQRDSIVRKVTGVDDVAARTPIVESGTTLLWLLRHLAHAETLWIVHRFAGEDIDAFDGALDQSDTIAAAVDAYRAVWVEVDAVVAGSPDLDEACRRAGEPPVNLRWVLMHLLEETARHAGHADILRELVDGQVGR
jgi:uncharacterized damage-inducible protein DinB